MLTFRVTSQDAQDESELSSIKHDVKLIVTQKAEDYRNSNHDNCQ